jgi:ferric-dicitrate binding protein FerR (iron transport regulator)
MLTINDRTEIDHTTSLTSPPASHPTPRRRRTRRIATIAAATLVVAGVAGVATIRSADSSPVPQSQDDTVRELVERGLVPAASLSDGTQITGSSAP